MNGNHLEEGDEGGGGGAREKAEREREKERKREWERETDELCDIAERPTTTDSTIIKLVEFSRLYLLINKSKKKIAAYNFVPRVGMYAV